MAGRPRHPTECYQPVEARGRQRRVLAHFAAWCTAQVIARHDKGERDEGSLTKDCLVGMQSAISTVGRLGPCSPVRRSFENPHVIESRQKQRWVSPWSCRNIAPGSCFPSGQNGSDAVLTQRDCGC